MRYLVLAIALTWCVPASAVVDFETTCTLRAAARLPRVPGLSVTKTEFKPIPAGVKQDPKLQYRLLNIEYTAVGKEYASTFVCVYGKEKDVVIVQPVK